MEDWVHGSIKALSRCRVRFVVSARATGTDTSTGYMPQPQATLHSHRHRRTPQPTPTAHTTRYTEDCFGFRFGVRACEGARAAKAAKAAEAAEAGKAGLLVVVAHAAGEPVKVR